MPSNTPHAHPCINCDAMRHCYDIGCGASARYSSCFDCNSALRTAVLLIMDGQQWVPSRTAQLVLCDRPPCGVCGKQGRVAHNGHYWCAFCYRKLADGSLPQSLAEIVSRASVLYTQIRNYMTPPTTTAEGKKQKKCQCNPCSGHTA